MRVLGGLYRGRSLQAPLGKERGKPITRPTCQKVRQALFNILADSVLDALVLDVCAGSGSLGIEALSRGARQVYFVDAYRRAVEVIGKNLEALGIRDQVVLCMDAAKSLHYLQRKKLSFNHIYIDPPYEMDVGVLLPLLPPLLCPEGIIVLEQDKRSSIDQLGDLEMIDHRIFGDTALFFLTHRHG